MSLIALLLALWRGGGIARWAEIAAGTALVFLAGFAFGGHIATSDAVKSAVETVQTHADREFASATGVIAANVKAANASIKIETGKNARAADLASAMLRAREASARRDRDAALAQLTRKRKELQDEVDKICVATDEPRVCGWSGDARRARRPSESPAREGRSHDCRSHGLTSLDIFASWQIAGQSVAPIIFPKAANVTASPRAAARR